MKTLRKLLVCFMMCSVVCVCNFCGDEEDKYARWPGGIIPYYIDPAFNENDKEKIYLAIDDWSNSGIIFEEIQTSGYYICHIKRGSENKATVGYTINSHIHLINGFDERIIRHELGHVICLPDEITREDRNDFVTILWDNIIVEQKQKFYISNDIPDWYYDNFIYDVESIMHYATYESSNGKGMSFCIKVEPKKIVYNFKVTEKDIEKVRKIYQKEI